MSPAESLPNLLFPQACERENGAQSTGAGPLSSGDGSCPQAVHSDPRMPVENFLARGGAIDDARRMTQIDGCPECVVNAELPKSVAPLTTGYRTAYLCADCGHAWTTDWKD